MSQYEQIVAMWQSFNVKNESDFAQRLDHFKILFAYHSGKIENDEIDFHDTREVFEHGRMSNFSGNPRTLFETYNQKIGYEFLLPHLVARTPLSLHLIKEVHRVLTEGTYDERRYIENGERPGTFKITDYVTGIHEVGARPEDVAKDLEDLLAEIDDFDSQITSKNILKVATYFHARFEAIHPFADGNGRVGRTLLNYLLIINNHPPLIVYEEDRREYYASLQKFDETEDLENLLVFFTQQLEKSWDTQLAKFQGKQTINRKTLTDIIK